MDTEQSKDSLFAEEDSQSNNQNPSVLQNAPGRILSSLTDTRTAQELIRTFAADLAARDAEITLLRRRNEELASIFKDHMCTVHNHSRLEADKILHDFTTPDTSLGQDLLSRLRDAAYSVLEEPSKVPTDVDISTSFNHGTPRGTLSRTSTHQETVRARNNSTVRGMLSVFGGRGTVRADKEKRQSIAGVLNTVKTAQQPRRASISQSLSSVPSRSPAPGPVEMNSIVEPEKLPPPLVTAKDIKYQYPAYTADIYGFIIDSNRTTEWLRENQPKSPAQQRGVDTPVTSASSIASAKIDPETDDEVADEEVETETTSWTQYLKVGGSALGSLSWLPIAQSPFANGQDIDAEPTSPEDIGHEVAVERLQQQLSVDYEKLQKSRSIPWERFLASDQQERARSDSFFTFLRRGQQPNNGQTRSTTDLASVGVLSKELRQERTRLILGGVPMHLRAKIWSQYIHEALIHDPDEYSSLVSQIPTDVAPETLSEICDDIPRTLANNVFFRSGAGRAQLTELLCTFVVKKPEIGYCQGMNLIGGYLLLALPTTETAFWVFCYMIEHVLAETYFDATMRGASIEIAVLRSYVRDLIPRLATHLDDLDIADQETVPYNWFLTAFSSTLTIEALYRVWDVVLALPTQKNFLLRVAIALLKVNEERLLAIEDAFELRNFMDRRMVGRGVGIEGLIKASGKLGAMVRDDEVRKRRKFYAFKVDEVGR